MSTPSSEKASEVRFQDLNLSAPLLEAIQSAGYSTATPIQARAIPLLIAGRDVLGQAQTGTGKTAAFALPMLARVDVERTVPQVLVLTPTRELAIQVADAFRRYGAGLPGLRVATIYGGQDYHIQFRQLDRGAHVVVGTPGRVMDHMKRSSLKLDGLRGLVLDEADEMLQMGFADDVEWVLTRAPAERQIALFSATIPESIRRIAQRHLKNPAEITIKQRGATPDTLRQRFVVVNPHQKREVLARVLEAEPIDGVLVFVNTKGATEPLAEYLSSQGHRTAALSGDVPQSARERIVLGLRSGKLDVIIATDVAARGLDVERISHVINYDFPLDTESYIHRIGRTGRASRVGDAVLFLHARGRHMLRRIEEATRQTIEPMEIPTRQVINQRRVARFHERITAGMAHPDLESFSRLVEQYRLLNNVPIERIAAVLAALAAGDTPLLLTEDLDQADFAETRDRRGRSQGNFRSRAVDGHRRTILDGESAAGRIGGSNPKRMETFRIEVGHSHQVKPANVVGAIANETGLEGRFIGRIQIFDEFSTVDMLAGIPEKVLLALKEVKILGRRLEISRIGSTTASASTDWPARNEPGAVAEHRPAQKNAESAGPEQRPHDRKSEAAAREHRPAGQNHQVGPSDRSRTVKKIRTKPNENRPARKKFKSKNKFKAKRAYVKS
ncbi:MAG TPA: DEAD/DEAH box helicase, partial [Pirellulales bacterium]|nr:DEAD/DEAH box helicase [Pirellulales bacterium]